jgi:hypothetical protein
MFVPSPFLSHDGAVVEPKSGRYYYADGFTTIGAALAYNPAGNVFPNGFKGYTERNGMQDGIVNGVKTNTFYYSNRQHVEYSRAYREVIQYTYLGNTYYGVLYIDPAMGYVGGNDTGIGNPSNQIRIHGTSYNVPSAIANRAIAENLANQAKVEVISKARNQKIDLSESLVDIDKSVMMIVKRMAQVLKAWEEARRGNWPGAFTALGLNPRRRRSAGDVFDVLANGWLEIQYGWLPLLSDIWNGVQFVNEGLQLPSTVYTVTRRVSGRLPHIQFMAEAPTGWSDYSITSDYRHDVEVKHTMRISNANLAYLAGIGLDNPAYLAWVGTPFSFVVDWMVPIGPWLQSLTTPLGLEYVTGYISRRTSGSIEVLLKRFYGSSSSRPVVYEDTPSRVVFSGVELLREPFTGFPVTLPYVRFPFSNPKRIISTIALLNQAKGRL